MKRVARDYKQAIECYEEAVKINPRFSVKKILWKNDTKGYRLHAHGRYSHSRSYIERTLDSAGFSGIECTEETLRMDMGKKVAGLIVTAKMTG